MKYLLWLLLATLPLAGRPNSAAVLTMVDCYMRAERPPSAQGLYNNGDYRGQVTFRNNSEQTIAVKSCTLHVLDGYGKPLFPLPLPLHRLPPHGSVSVPFTTSYHGLVGIFEFASDLTIQGADGQPQQLHLRLAQPKGSHKPSRGLPGY